MPLPTSGPISLANIQTEFGGSNPISLNEYYAGGGLVPSGTTGINGAIPTSGQISISQFYGAPAVTVQLDLGYSIINQTFSDPAYAGFRLDSNGNVIEREETGVGISTVDVGDWITPTSAAGADYQARATLNFGDSPQGQPLGTWLSLNTNREWYITAPVQFSNSFTELTVEIRRTSDQVVLATTTVSLSAAYG